MTSDGRLGDRAFVLTVAALVLLTPPIVTIFDVPILVFGIPLLHVYSFAVWLLVIVLGGLLATRMSRASETMRSGGADRNADGDV